MFSYDPTYNTILHREELYKTIQEDLKEFEKEKHNTAVTRGFYVYGECSTGKSVFIKELLKNSNYDIIVYNSADIRNKAFIQSMTVNEQSERSVLSLLKGKQQNICVVMDEIDALNMGDKGSITSLIKLIRGKKTKKQKKEEKTILPIFCIGNNGSDKKIKELMSVCRCYKMESPYSSEISALLHHRLPILKNEQELTERIVSYIDTDLHRFHSMIHLFQESSLQDMREYITTTSMLKYKNTNQETKDKVRYLLTNNVSFLNHNDIINETDRTTLSLLFHENIIDILKTRKQDKECIFSFYYKFLNNFCYADYIDRITFQKQIWVFNELSFLIKTVYNNNLLHKKYPSLVSRNEEREIRFTKVLTKYSTEYNNLLFMITLCHKLEMDRKDLLSFFKYHRENTSIEDLHTQIERYDITKLDIQRMMRFLDNHLD